MAKITDVWYIEYPKLNIAQESLGSVYPPAMDIVFTVTQQKNKLETVTGRGQENETS